MAHLHVIAGAEAHPAHPTIRTITISDLLDSLARGWADFSAMPSHALFLCLIYPVVAIFVAGLTMGYNILPLAFPIMAGFALIGPIVAIGLYEMSRRREAGTGSRSQPCLRRAAFAVAAGDRRARPAVAGDLFDLDRHRAADLSVAVRLPAAGIAAAIHQQRAHHAGRLAAHHHRQRGRLRLCRASASRSAPSLSRCCSIATSAPPRRS